MKCATGRDFFPSVHELRQAVSELRRQSIQIPNAYEAWEDLLKAGTEEYKDIHRDFIHPLVTRVAEMFGWPRLFPSNYLDQLSIDRAHYFKAYEQAVKEELEADIQLPEIKAFIERARLGDGNGQNK